MTRADRGTAILVIHLFSLNRCDEMRRNNYLAIAEKVSVHRWSINGSILGRSTGQLIGQSAGPPFVGRPR